jgi:hypothetical protein
MSDWETANLKLPLLAAGQAQKEWTHNEALTLVDALLPRVVEGVADTPPEAPAAGACWIVGAGAAGDWAGQAGRLACWTQGGWRFVAVPEGWAVWRRDRRLCARFATEGWTVGDAIADPSGGTVVDGEARAALTAVLAALRAHGLVGVP